jgi:hypothetical protein
MTPGVNDIKNCLKLANLITNAAYTTKKLIRNIFSRTDFGENRKIIDLPSSYIHNGRPRQGAPRSWGEKKSVKTRAPIPTRTHLDVYANTKPLLFYLWALWRVIRDRFYKTPFRPNTFRISFHPRISTQKTRDKIGQ